MKVLGELNESLFQGDLKYLFTNVQVNGPAAGQKAGFECHREVLSLKWVLRSDVWLKEQYVYLPTSRNAWLLKGDVTVLSGIIF